jgi:hypothetical protein
MTSHAHELAASGGPVVDGPALLGERAAFARSGRRAAIAPGGSCRLVRTSDSWLAVNLARPGDVALANAWLDDAGLDADDPWGSIIGAVRHATAGPLVERAADLGLAVSRLGEVDVPTPRVVEPSASTSHKPSPVVVDLSSLWAGPLCAQLLGLAGACVVKVESTERPDGARSGPPGFFDLLHHGHASVALAFRTTRGRDALRALIESADIVIEASRPRALEQLGVDAHAQAERGAVWVSISAYGRVAAPGRIGFGDDIAFAAGLHAGRSSSPLFCGDAIADPVTGLYAAVAALAAVRAGTGALLYVDMASVARRARGERRSPEREAELRGSEWFLDDVRVEAPRARPRSGRAAPLGADTARVMAAIGVRRWD